MKLSAGVRTVSRLCAMAGAAGVVALMLATVADVARRTLLGRPIAGVVEVSEVLLVAVVFLGAAYAQARREHVATTLLTARLGRRASAAVRSCSLALMAVLLVAMVWATGGRAADSVAVGEMRFGLVPVPMWPARVAITFGLLLLLAEVLLALAEAVRAVRAGGAGDACAPRTPAL
jgi:TRAP-type C4-dicarboxylate transport system permease small subunit